MAENILAVYPQERETKKLNQLTGRNKETACKKKNKPKSGNSFVVDWWKDVRGL